MPILRSKRRFGPTLPAQKALKACGAVVAVLFMVMCCGGLANADSPGLNASEATTFRGEIAKGLKIEMRLYQDGSRLNGTYVYEVFGHDIQVRGTINERGEIALQEFVKGKVTGNFAGRFVTNERIEGKWYKKSAGERGRNFYLVSTGGPLAVAPVSPTQKMGKADRQASPAPKVTRTAPTAVEAAAPAAAAAQAPRPGLVPDVKQQSAPVAREVSVPQQEKKIEGKTEAAQVAPRQEPVLLPVVAQEPPKVPVKTEAQPTEKPRIEGKAVDSGKKNSSPWKSFTLLFNMKMGAAVGGILLLGGGLGWLAVIAGGAAAFRDNSALFRRVHAMGLSFLPGIFLLALGVGAVLAAFVE